MEYRTRTRINCIRSPYKLVHLTINGEKIVTTDNHPFYVQGRGFIKAEGLFVGDKLISVDGKDLIVETHDIEQCEKPITVYNFKVEDYHTQEDYRMRILRSYHD